MADSSELVRRSMVRLLSDHFCVHPAADGSQALRYVERNPYCTLLTALKMAPMDGVELVRRVIQACPQRVGKIIVMTGWPEPHRWVPAGVVVLSKPVAPGVVLEAVMARVAQPMPESVN